MDGENSCRRRRTHGRTAPTETAPLHSVERLPATKCGEAAKTEARYRTAAQKRLSCYALANRVRLAKHQIIAGRWRLARAKLLKTNMTPGSIQTMPRRPGRACLDGKP